MKTPLLAALAFAAMTSAAVAEPMPLTAAEMDTITAGQVMATAVAVTTTETVVTTEIQVSGDGEAWAVSEATAESWAFGAAIIPQTGLLR